MAKQPNQRIVPYLVYEDAPAAIEFLCKSFGFEAGMQMPMPDGRLGHAELTLPTGQMVMLASVFPEMGQASPKKLGARHASVLCYVDDVDAHFRQAKASGAEIVTEPEDQFYGDRTYRVRDPEGHEWNFHTHVRDVPPEEMVPPSE